MLNSMGARISGLGTSRLVIEGVDTLRPADHEVVTDRLVAATCLAAAAITGGEVTVADARPEHMETLLRKLADHRRATCRRRVGVTAKGPARPSACDVATLPYPGVATDYKPLLVAVLSVADGTSVVTENLFEGRFRYVEELSRMGAEGLDGGPPRRDPRGRATDGRPGAGDGRPRGRGPRAGRARGRRRDRGRQRRARGPRLRGPGQASSARSAPTWSARDRDARRPPRRRTWRGPRRARAPPQRGGERRAGGPRARRGHLGRSARVLCRGSPARPARASRRSPTG